MRTRVAGFLVVVLLLGVDCVAERIPDKRENAAKVIIGTVESVSRRSDLEYKHFDVQIRVERMEKGAGTLPGELLHVYCLQRRFYAILMPGLSGHTAIPVKGQRIRAFLIWRTNRWEGIYPDWFDVVKASENVVSPTETKSP